MGTRTPVLLGFKLDGLPKGMAQPLQELVSYLPCLGRGCR